MNGGVVRLNANGTLDTARSTRALGVVDDGGAVGTGLAARRRCPAARRSSAAGFITFNGTRDTPASCA